MRILLHPHKDEMTLEAVLYALSDPTRLSIFAALTEAAAPTACAAFLEVGGAPVPKSTLSQHFRILREHGLVRSERQGVEMLSVPRREELDARFPGLIDAILAARRSAKA